MFEYIIGLVSGAFLAFVLVGGLLGGQLTDLKKEAYNRGHMVQCLGKTGYYWSCE